MEAGGYDPGIRILLCRMDRLARWDHENLSAPYWRFYWNREPGGVVSLKGRSTQLGPARCMAIAPNTPYASTLERRPVTHFYLHFLAAPPYDGVAPGLFSFPAEPSILAAVGEAGKLLGAGQATAGPRLAVLCHFLAAYALSQVPAESLPPLRSDERVLAAIRMMDENLVHPLANTDMAERVGMNPNAFIRLFRRSTGRSPQAFFAGRRIDQACLLLQGSGRSIKEIAAVTGFCDRYHFSRVFKKLRGVGPAEFRKRRYWDASTSWDVED